MTADTSAQPTIGWAGPGAAELLPRTAVPAGPWFRSYPAPRSAVRLVCFPHAGGTAGTFHTWSPLLAPDVELLAVQYPGRQERLTESVPARLTELADAIAQELVFFMDQPVALFGHSMGASLAYEVALRLEQLFGEVLAGLFVSGTPAPEAGPAGVAHLEDDATLLEYVREQGGPWGHLYEAPELRDLILTSLRSDLTLVDLYRPRELPVLNTRVAAFGGHNDPGCPPAGLASWQSVSDKPLRIRVFPGDHFYLLPQAANVVDEVCSLIAR